MKLLLQALSGETNRRPPFWLMRQAGRHLPEYRKLRAEQPNFLKFCYTPALAVEAALQPVRRYATDGAILFSDILVIPDALGRKVAFQEKIGPVLEPIRSAEELPGYNRNRLLAHLAPVFETVETLHRTLPKETALIGFAGAPWTVAVYMVEGRGGTDHGAIRHWAESDPEGFGKLMDLLTQATSDYLIEQVKSGAEVVQLFDTWAGLLAGEPFRRWVVQPTAAIVRKLRSAYPNIPIIGFPRGSGERFETYVHDTGVNAVGIDSDVALDWARDRLQTKVCVQGNLDNKLLVQGGAAMDEAMEKILAILGKGPFVFNLGHGILPETPPEHVVRLAERVRTGA
jgi:uroporphyrinogen decarboxylase